MTSSEYGAVSFARCKIKHEMKKIFLALVCSSLLFNVPSFAQGGDVDAGVADDVCAYMSIAAEKSLSKKLDLGLEGELRSHGNMGEFDRISLSPSLDYKIIKHLKFTVGGMY